MSKLLRILLLIGVSGVLVGLPAVPASAGGGCHRSSERGQPEAYGSVVDMVHNCMEPTVLRTKEGAEVRFVNRDEIVHNLWGAGWGVDELAAGAEHTERFARPGIYPFACLLHPGMIGTVVVGDGGIRSAASGTDAARLADVAPTNGGGTSTGGALLLAGGALVAMVAGGLALRHRVARD